MTGEVTEAAAFFAQAAVSIVLEAAPFLLLGSLASGLFEVFVPGSAVLRLVPKRALPGVFFGLVLGMLLPCCECGVVPLIRRFLAKGVPASTAMAYMLAGPVINPVVMASTYVAFMSDWGVVAWRVGIVGALALAVGLIYKDATAGELLAPQKKALANPFGDMADALAPAALCPPLRARLARAADHALNDFLDMGRILVIGALVAAAFKTLAPAGLMDIVEKDLLLSVLAMMVLAVCLSLCSQADAFVAASFTGFPLAAKLAFMTLGPVLDIKLVLMWGGAFRPAVVRTLILVPLAMVFAASMALGLWQAGVVR